MVTSLSRLATEKENDVTYEDIRACTVMASVKHGKFLHNNTHTYQQN